MANTLRKYRFKGWLEYKDLANYRANNIDKALHSALYEAVTTRTIQKIIDSKCSSLEMLMLGIIKRWFADNGGNSMTNEKVMNNLEILVLSSNSTTKGYIGLFFDIIDRLDMEKSSLLLAH